jgi:hypothetical protein
MFNNVSAIVWCLGYLPREPAYPEFPHEKGNPDYHEKTTNQSIRRNPKPEYSMKKENHSTRRTGNQTTMRKKTQSNR